MYIRVVENTYLNYLLCNKKTYRMVVPKKHISLYTRTRVHCGMSRLIYAEVN